MTCGGGSKVSNGILSRAGRTLPICVNCNDCNFEAAVQRQVLKMASRASLEPLYTQYPLRGSAAQVVFQRYSFLIQGHSLGAVADITIVAACITLMAQLFKRRNKVDNRIKTTHANVEAVAGTGDGVVALRAYITAHWARN